MGERKNIADLLAIASKFDNERKYWTNKLSGELEETSFPYNHYKTKINEHKTAMKRFSLEGELFSKIMWLSNESDHRLYVLLVAGLNLLLKKYTGNRDVLIGAPVYKQNNKENHANAALFIRNQVDDNITFKELILIVKKTIDEAIENQNYPIELLIKQLFNTQSNDRASLLDVVILLENIQDKKNIDKFNPSISFSFERTENCINGSLEYNSLLYEEAYIYNIIAYFIQLLRKAIFDVNVNIDNIEIMTEKEIFNTIDTITKGKAGCQKYSTMQELFEEQVKKNPDNIAVVFGDDRFTYRELNRKANGLAGILRSKGVKADTIVGLLLDNSIDMIVAILAILKAGGAYLPIDISTPQSRIKSMLDDCKAALILTQSKLIDEYSFTALQNIQTITIEPYVTKTRAQITDLDGLPFPDRSLVDYDKYSKRIGLSMVKNIIAVQGTRGCPYNCAYCHKIWPKSHYKRSAENIFEEIMLYYRLGVRRFAFVDDIFNLDVRNSKRFFELVIDNNLDIQIHFPAGLRGDILTKEYIDLMVRAGTVSLGLALETASERLQKLIGKNLNIEKISENIKYLCEKYPHVILEVFIMHGFPTETQEEAELTLDFVKKHKWIHFPYFHILKIYPNTDMEALALANGVSKEAIINSTSLAYHKLPDTLPFDKSFTVQYQTDFLNEYFLSKERLLHVLPYQMKILTEDELVQKYDSYLPIEITCFDDLLKFIGITKEELNAEFLSENSFTVLDLNSKIKNCFPKKECSEDALRVLLLDTSQYFSNESNMLYDVIEPPLGLMYLMTYLNEEFGSKINGRLAKSRVDFDSYEELKGLLKEFKPDVIGIRTLTYYKDFFHKTAAMIRQWGFDIPILVGGPYGTSDYKTILQDKNIDVIILGEGEETTGELIGKIMLNNRKLPCEDILKEIPGIAFLPDKEKLSNKAGREIIMLDDMDELKLEFNSELDKNLDNINQPSDLAYIIYTSGTTGIPKGAMIEHKNVVQLMHSSEKMFDFNNKDIWTMFHSYCFDFSVWEMYGALFYGGKLVVIPKSIAMDTREYIKVLRKEGVTVLNQTPSIFYRLIQEELQNKEPELQIRYVVFGGEALQPAKLKPFYDRYQNTKLINMYGITETTVHVTYKEITKEEIDSNISNIGRPIPTLTAYVMDKNMKLLPAGIAGELCVGGDGVCRGYLNQEELTAEKFVQNPYKENERIYRSGDLVRILPTGDMEYLGRIDNQVKVRGFRIELGEIESKLLGYEYIKEAVVLTKNNEEGERYLCAYIVADEEETGNRKLMVTELREYLLKDLPNYMIPSYFIQIDSIPITSNGKVNRKALPEPTGNILTGVEYEAQRNETEERLVGIWKEVLQLERIGINDNFFEIGGDSLKAIAITAKLNHEVSVADLLKHSTIAGLASVMKNKEYKMLYNLKKAYKEKCSIICIPYAGGNSFVYQKLSEELTKISDEYSIYSIEMPRDEKAKSKYSNLISIAEKSVEEICSSITNKAVYIYGHCMGVLMSIIIGRLLEKRGYEVKGVFLGGMLPYRKNIINRGNKDPYKNKTDEEVMRFLNGIGGFKDLESNKNIKYSISEFRDDVILATNHELEYQTTTNSNEKLSCPIHCIIGDNDPITKNYKSRYKKWNNISSSVSLSVIEAGDHYFVKGQAEQLARRIKEIIEEKKSEN